MGYACPVCGDPQADDEHLANHLAFTAMLGDEAHEDWLAEHAPDWDEHDADRLAATVTDHAEEVDFPQVFEDTTGHDHDHDDERSGALFDDEARTGDGFDAAAARDRAREQKNPELEAEAEDIMAEARELTERMRDSDADEAEGEDEGGATDAADGASDTDTGSDEAETE
jgi:hypothetical protein